MASVHTNTYGGRTITLEVVEESWSIETNTSVVRWTLRSGTSSTYHSVYQITAWVGGTDDAHKVYGPKTADWSSRAFPCKDGSTTGTVTVQHNADGTASPLTFRLKGSVYNNNPQNYDGSIDLTTIPRATTDWSISGDTIGSNVTVTLRPNSSSFTHRVICYFGNDSQELSVASNQQSASATIKMAFCNQVPNATSGSGTMVVETYNAGQLIGSNSKPITLNVPNNVVPSISSVAKSDTANLVGTYGAYVQGKSNLRVVTSSNGSYSSSISNVTVNIKDSNNNLLRQLSGSDVTLSNISYVGNLTIQVIVTDTRGRQASNTSPISVVEYFNPRINSFNAERRNNDSTVTITFSADICNINNNNVNSKEFRLYKRQKGTSSWGNAILTYNSAYSYSRNDFTTTCDENYGWEFLLQAQDSFTTTSNDNPEVGTAFELINWKDDGTAMAVGKVSEESNTLEVGLNSKFYRGLTSYSGVELLHATPFIDFHYGNSSNDYTSRIIEESSGALTFICNMQENGYFTINTPTNVWSGQRINASNRNEASIEYYNNAQNKRIVAGYGTSGFDGYGIYSDFFGNIMTCDFYGGVLFPGTLNYRKTFYLQFSGADNAPQWFLLARFNKNIYDGGNHSMLVINGTFGGWASGDRTTFKFTFGDRNGYTCYGYQAGNNSGFNDYYDFEVYENGDIKELYLHRKARWVSEVLLDIQGEDIEIFNSSTPTSPSGTLVYTIGSWLPNISQLNEVVLYNDDNGTNGNVTLSESAGNFRCLEIYYKVSNNHNSTKIYNANGKETHLTVNENWISGSNRYLNIRTKNISINGNTITSNRNDWTQILNNNVNAHNSNNDIYITRVVGYRW